MNERAGTGPSEKGWDQALDFAATADAHRRAGRLVEAEQVVREGLRREPDSREGVLVLSLVLLEQGRQDDARQALESWCVDGLPEGAPREEALPVDESDSAEVFADDVSESELDQAFDDAEAEREQMIDADTIAQRAIEAADRLSDDPLGLEPTFATETVAGLLERQGDEQGASRIRAQLVEATVAPEGSDEQDGEDWGGRRGKIEELERWLQNLRGGAQ